MIAVKRLEIETKLSILKTEQAERIGGVTNNYLILRNEAKAKLVDSLYKIQHVYNEALSINKAERRRLWVEKLRFENTTPVDLDAITNNRAEHSELIRQANALSEQLNADIRALKQKYYAHKHQLSLDEYQEINAIKTDIISRKHALVRELGVLIAEKKGGTE